MSREYIRREDREDREIIRELSRRDFLKGAAAGAAGIAAMGMAGGVWAAETEAGEGDWLEKPDPVDESAIAETLECEVLVVGAGNAGLFAAGAAAENGAKTIVLEKNAMGQGVRTSALGAIGSRMQKSAGVEIDKTEYINDLARYASFRCDMRLLKLFADESAEMMDWYLDRCDEAGAIVKLEYDVGDDQWRYRAWPTGHGTREPDGSYMGNTTPTTTKAIQAYCEKFDCKFYYETPMQYLEKDGDRVCGAIALNAEGRYIRITASKGVILCTGGYANNREMYHALQPDTEKSLTYILCWSGATGDGIRAGLWAGAAMDYTHTSMLFDRGAVPPEIQAGDLENANIGRWTMASQPFLKVDGNGERICNEAVPYDFLIMSAARRPGRCWYQIYDANWKEDVTRFDTNSCSTLVQKENGNHHAAGLDSVEASMEAMIENGIIFRCDTLEELSEKLGLPQEQFLATVARYNELYDMGADVDYGKEFVRMSSIRTPPYYGCKIGAWLLCTMDGLCIDPDMRVLDENAKPIPGLFAAGCDSGNYFYTTYPNRSAGAFAGRAATFARHAGRYLANL